MRVRTDASAYSGYLWFIIELISIAAFVALLPVPTYPDARLVASASPASYQAEIQPKLARVQEALQHLVVGKELDLTGGKLFDTAWRAAEISDARELEAAAN